MQTLTTPGVYRLPPIATPAPLTAIRTDVAGFVGIARRGPLHKAVRVESHQQFLATFGGPCVEGYLAHAVEGFFRNGGAICHVVRVAHRVSAAPARWHVYADGGRRVFELEARHPGTYLATDLRISLTNQTRKTFQLRLEIPGEVLETWENLSSDPGASDGENSMYFETRLNGLPQHADDDATDDVALRGDKPVGSSLVRVSDVRSYSFNTASMSVQRIKDGRDGLSDLEPADFYVQRGSTQLGLSLLESVDEVSIVAMPDLMPASRPPQVRKRPKPVDCSVMETPQPSCCAAYAYSSPPTTVTHEQRPEFSRDQIRFLQMELIRHCAKQRDRVAVLDSWPMRANPEEVIAWRKEFDTKYAALYYPWLKVDDAVGAKGDTRFVPPSGHVAGIYAATSLRMGPHKPPANAVVEGGRDVESVISDSFHGLLNTNRVNVIKSIPGRGIRVMGARTLSSDTVWRFVNVRRLVTMIEEVIDELIQWAVHEPHNAKLRHDIDRVIRSFLTKIWTQGMLDGETADEAFSVTCDETTNTQRDVDEGRLICQIVLNVPWPAEFVTVQIGLGSREGVNFTEVSGGSGG